MGGSTPASPVPPGAVPAGRGRHAIPPPARHAPARDFGWNTLDFSGPGQLANTPHHLHGLPRVCPAACPHLARTSLPGPHVQLSATGLVVSLHTARSFRAKAPVLPWPRRPVPSPITTYRAHHGQTTAWSGRLAQPALPILAPASMGRAQPSPISVMVSSVAAGTQTLKAGLGLSQSQGSPRLPAPAPAALRAQRGSGGAPKPPPACAPAVSDRQGRLSGRHLQWPAGTAARAHGFTSRPHRPRAGAPVLGPPPHVLGHPPTSAGGCERRRPGQAGQAWTLGQEGPGRPGPHYLSAAQWKRRFPAISCLKV